MALLPVLQRKMLISCLHIGSVVKRKMNFTEHQLSLFLSAVTFAADKHRHQRRKGADASPYINHPIKVAELLWSVGGVRDMNTLGAALLHDTIEDTGTTPEEIAALFGAEVLSLVQECTDDKSLPKAERKRLQILHAPHISAAAKQLKLADKINNVEDLTNFPPSDWSLERRIEYLGWTEQVIAGLRGVNPALDNHFAVIIEAARKKVEAESKVLTK